MARSTYDWGGGTLTREQTAQVLSQAGFTGQALVDLVAIAGRESGYRPGIHGSDQPQSSVSGDRGLFQINYIHDDRLRQAGIIDSAEDLFDPVTNARAAYFLSGGGSQGGINQLWGAGPGGWQSGGDPFYGTDRAAAAAAVENARRQGLLDTQYRAGSHDSDYYRDRDTRAEQEAAATRLEGIARRMGNMGDPRWAGSATANRDLVRTRRQIVSKMLGEGEHTPQEWATAAQRLGNRGNTRFTNFATREVPQELMQQRLGDLGMPRFEDQAAIENESVLQRRREAIRHMLGEGPQQPDEWAEAATKLANKGNPLFKNYASVGRKTAAKRYENRQERIADQKVMTDMLRGIGVKYPNAPRPTPALLAYLRGVGINLSTAEDVRREARGRTKLAYREELGDVGRDYKRTKQNIGSDLVRRGVYQSGEANTRFARHEVDTAEAKGDLLRARQQGMRGINLGFRQTVDPIRQAALERIIGEETNQRIERQTRRATARGYRRQERAQDEAYQQQKDAADLAYQRQIDLIDKYAQRGIVV